jgi:hypothetical protein
MAMRSSWPTPAATWACQPAGASAARRHQASSVSEPAGATMILFSQPVADPAVDLNVGVQPVAGRRAVPDAGVGEVHGLA